MDYKDLYPTETWVCLPACKVLLRGAGDTYEERVWARQVPGHENLVGLDNIPLNPLWRWQDIVEVSGGVVVSRVHRRWNQEVIFKYKPKEGEADFQQRSRIYDTLAPLGYANFLLPGLVSVYFEDANMDGEQCFALVKNALKKIRVSVTEPSGQ